MQVAPYKPSVPSQVSQIKKTKALRLELQWAFFPSPAQEAQNTEIVGLGNKKNKNCKYKQLLQQFIPTLTLSLCQVCAVNTKIRKFAEVD